MEKITKERIDNIINNVSQKVTENTLKDLNDNILKLKLAIENAGIKNEDNEIIYQSILSTSIQNCVSIMKESLYELLCDEWFNASYIVFENAFLTFGFLIVSQNDFVLLCLVVTYSYNKSNRSSDIIGLIVRISFFILSNVLIFNLLLSK